MKIQMICCMFHQGIHCLLHIKVSNGAKIRHKRFREKDMKDIWTLLSVTILYIQWGPPKFIVKDLSRKTPTFHKGLNTISVISTLFRWLVQLSIFI